MMKLFFLLLIAAAAATNFESGLETYTYSQYVADFDKTYDAAREEIFYENLNMIRKHNSEGHSWKMAVNRFADMHPSERKAFYSGVSPALLATLKGGQRRAAAATPVSFSSGPLPNAVDWREKNVITPVKNQGGCGSCWAFAVTEEVESFVAMKTKTTAPILSPQDVTSCAENPHHCGGTGGCKGATAEIGLDYVHKHGIALEEDYPYKAETGICIPDIQREHYIDGYVQLPTNNYTALVTALATVGPIAVSVDASAWPFYSSGIFDGCKLEDVGVNHAVQAVGYGSENGKDYWIVRNSWGTTWGETGYIRILRHSDGDMKWCGIDKNPQDGVGCEGGPDQVKTCGSCGIWLDSSYPLIN